MSSVALYRDFHLRGARVAGSRRALSGGRRGLFKRISAAIERWQRGHREVEAGRFIAEHGGRLTDDIERQLALHFNGRGFPTYAARRRFGPFS